MSAIALLPFLFVGIVLSLNVLILGFWIWMLVDCVANEHPGKDDQLIWVLVIVLANWIGAVVYFFVGRKRRLEFTTESIYKK